MMFRKVSRRATKILKKPHVMLRRKQSRGDYYHIQVAAVIQSGIVILKIRFRTRGLVPCVTSATHHVHLGQVIKLR
jgi:hypothetical protein